MKRALVIIPTYNERETLPVVIDSVLKHEGFDVLVVDDASPDGTAQLVKNLMSKKLKSPSSNGPANSVWAPLMSRVSNGDLREATTILSRWTPTAHMILMYCPRLSKRWEKAVTSL